MLDRRTFIALSAALPLVGKGSRLDIPDPRIHEQNTGGAEIIGISPDGSTLVGKSESDQLCFFSVATGDLLVETDPYTEVAIMDPLSVAWSPDGSRIAFSLQAWRLLRDSDIFVVDVRTGAITNVTPEGHEQEAMSLLEVPDVSIDVSPVWLNNDTLLFARHQGIEDSATLDLMTLTLSDGQVATFVELAPANLRYITSRIWQNSDGSMIFGADGTGTNGLRYGVMTMSPDRELSNVDLGEIGHPQLIDVSETHILVSDAATFDYWYIPLDPAEPREKLWNRFEIPGDMSLLSTPALGPDPDTLVVVLKTSNDQSVVYLFEGAQSRQVAELRGEAGGLTCQWVGDTILVTGRDASWIVELE